MGTTAARWCLVTTACCTSRSATAAADSDDRLTAQDASNLLGKILRIDVDHPAAGMKYAIPPDNPFLNIKGARGEIWSLGHRNPWRMAVDAKTGGLWVGNNGQDLWEFAHLIKRGDNCGWSVYEGSHPFYLNRQQGPGRFAPPTVEHDHGAFRSLTGGVVYYGHRLPELEGAYIYGDYSTGAIWGVHHDGTQVVWNRELAKTTLDIVAFATSHREELLVVDYASGIYRLVESPPDDSHRRFPRQVKRNRSVCLGGRSPACTGRCPLCRVDARLDRRGGGRAPGRFARRQLHSADCGKSVGIPRRRGARSNSFAPAASWRPWYSTTDRNAAVDEAKGSLGRLLLYLE